MTERGKPHTPAVFLSAAIVVGCIVLQVLPALARQAGQGAAPAPRVVTATRVDEAPTLDGNVLTDPVWARVTPTTGFTQIAPDEGAPASERTEVRIAYNADTLFVGVVCYDRSPSEIVVGESRRDSALNNTDSFRMLFDTFHDRQNGFVFSTTPVGLEHDGQLTTEGAGSGRAGGGAGGARVGGGQQRGSGGGFNLNWDGSWDVRTSVTEIGWSAEFAIPFRTLRYPSAETQTWGVNFQRDIRRRVETSFWAPLPRQYNLNRVSLAGELSELLVPPQRNLKLTPYVLGQAVRHSADGRTVRTGDLGGDLKYSLTPSLTLDLTYNTDFAQVEVDEEQVNLDRFNMFFPEKRPFFLDNAGLFSIGSPGRIEAFFSRRIGISPSGVPIPIIGGARLQGKVAGVNVGVLNMQTGTVEGVEAADNFSVVRLRRDLQNRSNLGVMFVNRQGTGDLAGSDDWNRTLAFDGRIGIGQNGTISGYVIASQTPGVRDNEHAFSVTASRNTQALRSSIGFTEVAPNFNPEAGFVRRRNFRRVNGSLFSNFRPADFMKLQEVRPHVSHFTVFAFDSGLVETQYTHIDNHWEFKSGDEVHTGINVTKERVFTPFEIFPGVVVPPGSYDHVETQLALWTDKGEQVSANLNFNKGGFFGGKRLRYGPSVDIKAGEKFIASLALSHNDIDLPGGSFITNVFRTRLSYTFTPRMFVQALVQYNDRADIWSSNLRFGLLSQANTGLFVVFNDTQGLHDVLPTGAGRSVIVKYSRLLDLLN